MKKQTSSTSASKNKKSIANRSILQLAEHIITLIEDGQLSDESLKKAKPFCEALAQRMNITTEEAMWLSVFISMFQDNCIGIHDFARFFGCNPITILSHWDPVEKLIERGFIQGSHSPKSNVSLRVPRDLMAAVRTNQAFVQVVKTNLTLEQWIDELDSLIAAKDSRDMEFDDFLDGLTKLKQNSPKLPLVHKLKSYGLDEMDEIILLRTIANFVERADEQIGEHDIDDLVASRSDLRFSLRKIACGQHPLQKLNLIENLNEDGRANGSVWHLTDEAKEDLLQGLDIIVKEDNVSGLTKFADLKEKKLFFNADVSKQVDKLRSLLSQERFKGVQDRLEKNGMRRGFACIFYGAPGTGKTETVYQIARETGRNIMMVDVPSLRSKWVGDSEKNIKAVFTRYNKLVKESSVAPILLFNEADGVLSTRTSAGVNPSVEKMENTMQNIILQEMEDLKGIMIATTNLTENLDDAFERRFLYKIEFPKPSPTESCQIWRSMLPELSEADALNLARSFDFSGGQIENVARKRIVDAVLNDEDTLSMSAICEACSCERLKTKKITGHIGFA